MNASETVLSLAVGLAITAAAVFFLHQRQTRKSRVSRSTRRYLDRHNVGRHQDRAVISYQAKYGRLPRNGTPNTLLAIIEYADSFPRVLSAPIGFAEASAFLEPTFQDGGRDLLGRLFNEASDRYHQNETAVRISGRTQFGNWPQDRFLYETVERIGRIMQSTDVSPHTIGEYIEAIGVDAGLDAIEHGLPIEYATAI